MYKKYGITGLFLLLVVALILKPRVLFNLYKNILGRLLLIGVVLFFTMCNVTLGLLSALCLIIASNMFFMEGLENINNDGTTIGDDNADGTSSDETITIQTKAKAKAEEQKEGGDSSTISELKDQSEEQGVDRSTIHESIQPKSSKTMPVDQSNFSSDEVRPNASSSTVAESFTSRKSFSRV